MTALDELLGEGLAWPDVFPAHLSPSSIAEMACPEKWRRKRLLGEREPWSGAALVGTVVHRAVEHNFRHKLEHGHDLPVPELEEVCAAAWDDRVEEAKQDGINWGDTRPGDAKDQSVLLARVYREQVAPRVVPVAVEEWVDATVQGVPVPLVGRVDVRTASCIPDVKTTGRKLTHPKGDWRLKGSLYVLMTGMPFEWHVLTKTKTPGVYTPDENPGLRLPASDAVKHVAGRRVFAAAASLVDLFARYGPDEPWPTTAPEHEWLCSPKFCSFRSTCPWVAE